MKRIFLVIIFLVGAASAARAVFPPKPTEPPPAEFNYVTHESATIADGEWISWQVTGGITQWAWRPFLPPAPPAYYLNSETGAAWKSDEGFWNQVDRGLGSYTWQWEPAQMATVPPDAINPVTGLMWNGWEGYWQSDKLGQWYGAVQYHWQSYGPDWYLPQPTGRPTASGLWKWNYSSQQWEWQVLDPGITIYGGDPTQPPNYFDEATGAAITAAEIGVKGSWQVEETATQGGPQYFWEWFPFKPTLAPQNIGLNMKTGKPWTLADGQWFLIRRPTYRYWQWFQNLGPITPPDGASIYTGVSWRSDEGYWEATATDASNFPVAAKWTPYAYDKLHPMPETRSTAYGSWIVDQTPGNFHWKWEADVYRYNGEIPIPPKPGKLGKNIVVRRKGSMIELRGTATDPNGIDLIYVKIGKTYAKTKLTFPNLNAVKNAAGANEVARATSQAKWVALGQSSNFAKSLPVTIYLYDQAYYLDPMTGRTPKPLIKRLKLRVP